MKKIVYVLLGVIFFIAGCATIQKQQEFISSKTIKEVESKVSEVERKRQLVQFKREDGYFLKNNIKLSKEINFFTINSSNQFVKLLGISKTMLNKVTIPNFDKNIVTVIAMKPSQYLNNISINQIYMIDNNMYIEYKIEQNMAKDFGYFVSNMAVFKIAKPQVIINVCFIDNERNMTVVPFGDRNRNSPANVSEMLNNYTGVYKGTLSAAEGNIFTELNLKEDYSYTLKQEYLTINGKIFQSFGKWYPSENLSSFVLNKNKDLIFYFVDKNTIEKLDNKGAKIKSDLCQLKK